MIRKLKPPSRNGMKKMIRKLNPPRISRKRIKRTKRRKKRKRLMLQLKKSLLKSE